MEIFKSTQRKKAEHVVRLLTQKNYELTTMESCTGGGLAHILTSIPGAGSVYQGGYVTYSNFSKMNAGVPSEVLSTPDGPYHEQVAIAMARASLRDPFHPLPQNGDAIGVGITGTLDNPDKFYTHIPTGKVWVGIVHGDQQEVYQLSAPRRGRSRMKNTIINQTLDLIAQTIEPRHKNVRRNNEIAN